MEEERKIAGVKESMEEERKIAGVKERNGGRKRGSWNVRKEWRKKER
jgi:hypothetical protein